MVTGVIERPETKTKTELEAVPLQDYRGMKALVVGKGGREHAIAWKLSSELGSENVFVAPGNAGTSKIATNVPCKTDDFKGLADFAELHKIGFTIVGPDEPIANGIADYFTGRGLHVFAPDKKAARLESSKVFAKRFMRYHNIPTADFMVVDSFDDARIYGLQLLKDYKSGVVKLDGLAAGKGVVVYKSEQDLDDGLVHLKSLRPNDRIIVEKCLKGEEASFMAWTDGEHIVPMIPIQDHKPVYDGDKGPNTGGMGAYTNPTVIKGLKKRIIREIMQPAIEGMEGKYKGVLYAGLMIVDGQPYALEFNCRYGDPEVEVVLPLLESSLFDISYRCTDGTLDKADVKWKKGEALDVVMATQGYPGDYEQNIGKVIYGLDEVERMDNVLVFHAGTKYDEHGRLVNSGGRVLNIVGTGKDLLDAFYAAYKGANRISARSSERLNGIRFHYRTDVGKKTLGF